MIVIVPNSLRLVIDTLICALTNGMEIDENSRGVMFNQLLSYYDEHGILPEIADIRLQDNRVSNVYQNIERPMEGSVGKNIMTTPAPGKVTGLSH